MVVVRDRSKVCSRACPMSPHASLPKKTLLSLVLGLPTSPPLPGEPNHDGDMLGREKSKKSDKTSRGEKGESWGRRGDSINNKAYQKSS